MGTPLDDILSDGDSETVTEVTEAVTPDVGQQGAEPEVTEDGQPQAEPEPSDDEPKGWQYAAYKDEKTKRQELEKQASDYQRQLEQERQERLRYQQFYEQQQQAAVQQDPRLMAQQISQTVEERVSSVEAKARLNMSEALALRDHGKEKVEIAKQAFQELAKSDPIAFKPLYEQFGTGRDPIGEIVKWHAKQETLAKLGDDPDAYIQAQVQAKLAELQGVQPGQQGKPAVNPNTMPTDLSQTRNVGTRTGSNWSGPTPLGDIFKD
mgnify:CR=1 FL=1